MTNWLNQMINMNKFKKDNTEEKIVIAAQKVFVRKGMDGARMQEIANEAGINKALLHYYFRSKQKLFEAIFTKIFQQIFPNILMLMNTERPIAGRLQAFVENYLDILIQNQELPAFIIQEINRDPQIFRSIFETVGLQPKIVFEMFEQEMEAGNIVRMNPRDLMLNILSMCLFPFAASPLMQMMMFENDKKSFQDFLNERKKTVTEFILNSILIKKQS